MVLDVALYAEIFSLRHAFITEAGREVIGVLFGFVSHKVLFYSTFGSRSRRLSPTCSDNNAFHFVKSRLIRGAIIEFGGLG